MKKIEELTNLYSVSKTLQFKLIPVGKTEENFAVKHYLETDEKLAEDYIKMKGEIVACHRKFIDDCLSEFAIDGNYLDEYYAVYKKSDRSDDDKKLLDNLQDKMKSAIEKALVSDERYKRLVGKDMIAELLANTTNDEAKQIISSFAKFTTYFDVLLCYGFYGLGVV
jgi:CRISPR-associated protein Cpf1